jgi:hypothetical protein
LADGDVTSCSTFLVVAGIVIPPVAFLETLYRSEALAGLGLKPVEPRPANLTSGDF